VRADPGERRDAPEPVARVAFFVAALIVVAAFFVGAAGAVAFFVLALALPDAVVDPVVEPARVDRPAACRSSSSILARSESTSRDVATPRSPTWRLTASLTSWRRLALASEDHSRSPPTNEDICSARAWALASTASGTRSVAPGERESSPAFRNDFMSSSTGQGYPGAGRAVGIIRRARTGVCVATKREVERKLRELIRRLDRSGGDVRGSLSDALPDPRVIEVAVTDLGVSYWTTLASGSMSTLHPGPAVDPEIRGRLTSDRLVDLVDGRASLFHAYLAGHVKIDASFGDLLRLRRLA
jgi:hypothetical protein